MNDVVQQHPAPARKPSTGVATSTRATEPNRLWPWAIAWLPKAVKGLCYYWYKVLDVYSRKILDHDVYVAASVDPAARWARDASLTLVFSWARWFPTRTIIVSVP